MTPCRVADTRTAPTVSGSEGRPWPPGRPREFQVTGRCGIPADALAVAANVTVGRPRESAGYLTLRPPRDVVGDQHRQLRGRRTRANSATVGLGGTGTVSVFCNTVGGGAANFILDVVGYYK